MAHFTFTRTGGVWVAGTVVDAAEAADLDAKTYAAINGDAGGSWSPTAIISIAGQGLRLYGSPFQLFDSIGPNNVLDYDPGSPQIVIGADCLVDFVGGAFLQFETGTWCTYLTGTTLNVNSGATVNNAGTNNSTGNWSVTAGTWTFAGATFNVNSGTWTYHNASVYESGATVNVLGTAGAFAFANNVSFSGSLLLLGTTQIGGTPSITAPMSKTGAGRIIDRVAVGTDADQTYDVATTDEVYVPSGVLTTNRNYTIADATAGSRMRVICKDSTYSVTLKRSGGSTIAVLKDLSTNTLWVDLVWVGSQWEWDAIYKVP